VDMRLVAMNEMLEFTRRELLAEIKFADRRSKIAPLRVRRSSAIFALFVSSRLLCGGY